MVSRWPASRWFNYRRGRRLGPDDYVVTWHKTDRPEWVTLAEASDYPDTLTIRVTKIRIGTRGFRVKEVLVITTLLDAEKYSRAAIAELYRLRWQIELFLRWLKVFACFDHLISKNPRGITLQFYVAVLLTLLLHMRTGMPVSKHTLHLLALSARGQMTPEMTAVMLARRAREQWLERQRKRQKALA